MRRHAKIVCTLGPAVNDAQAITALVEAGMDVARLNFSHGTHEAHRQLYARVRQASDASGRAVGILADLQGPKLRLGRFEGGEAVLERGGEFVLTVRAVTGTAQRASTTYAGITTDLSVGDPVLLNDGRVRLEVEAIDGEEVRTRVLEGGVISDHKGINLPGSSVSAETITEKDLADLRFALNLRVDLVALSFVRKASDAEAVRAVMNEMHARVPVIAKLEKPEALENLEAILDAFDGLMVARGDLGVELPLEQVPLVQKRAVRMARERGKPVIVATQMLDSMVRRSRPTRAEASDVANAVLDGADALMLSDETAVGEYSLEAVRTMRRIIVAAEGDLRETLLPLPRITDSPPEAITAAAPRVARDLNAAALVAFTLSGDTARRLARHRPEIPLLVFTTEPSVRSQLALVWGVETFVVPEATHTDAMIAQVDRSMLDLGRGRRGQQVVIVAGSPPGTPGSTNMIRVHRLGSL